ncbi:MAG: hypothetical protein DRI71_02595 [Bacteroidetes bacterium]|nr:MAG: hypothetical protein DRI71_02595 [Bacteroidota bacterium]
MNKINVIPLAVVIAMLSLAVLPTSVYGQTIDKSEEEQIRPKNIIAIVPQYAFFRGIRIDYERSLKGGNHWLVIAPQFYLDVNNSAYYYSSGYGGYETMTGIGINLYYKTIVYESRKGNVNSNLPRHSFYISGGPNFQYFNLQNSEEVAQPFTNNGTTYYQYNIEAVNKPIYRIGAVADVGWQMAFDRFLLDLYLGVALKYSMDGNGDLINETYSDWVEPTYTGILLDGGLRLGLFF